MYLAKETEPDWSSSAGSRTHPVVEALARISDVGYEPAAAAMHLKGNLHIPEIGGEVDDQP